MNTTVENADTSAKEMARSLKQIVDNNFEEAEFEKGIAMLEQLRSHHHVPSIAHILHLIYIALHPIKDIQLNATGAEDEDNDPLKTAMASPRKIVKHTKSHRVLTAGAVTSAQKLLAAFVRTNSPASLAEALPFYPDVTLEAPFEIELVDSVIFLQVKYMRDNSKSCWDLVKTGALENAKRAYLTTAKSKGRSQPLRGGLAYSSGDGTENEDVKPVGENSWFMLSWLLDLFEKDAEESVSKGLPRHSPLLLKQIPRAAHGSNTKWDCSEPIRIILHASQQPQSRRQSMGMRLLILLIELTQLAPTPLLSMQGLMTSTIARFSTPSPSNSLSPAILPQILIRLPPVPAALVFRLALCRRILQDALVATSSSGPSTARAGPKPRALARKGTASSIATEPSSKPDNSTVPVATLSQAPPQMPPYKEFDQLASAPIPTRAKKTDNPLAAPDFLLRMKFEMFLACATLRRLLKSSGSSAREQADIDNEKEWSDALHNQAIFGLLDSAFGGPLPANVEEEERSCYVATLRTFFAGLT